MLPFCLNCCSWVDVLLFFSFFFSFSVRSTSSPRALVFLLLSDGSGCVSAPWIWQCQSFSCLSFQWDFHFVCRLFGPFCFALFSGRVFLSLMTFCVSTSLVFPFDFVEYQIRIQVRLSEPAFRRSQLSKYLGHLCPARKYNCKIPKWMRKSIRIRARSKSYSRSA